MRVLMVTQFYPPVIGGQERHVRDLAHALARRGHAVEVATIAVDGRPGTDTDGQLVRHRLPSAAQRVPALYSDAGRPHAMPIADPLLRRGLARLLAGGRFDVAHAHDWSVNSLLGPAGRAGVPVVLTQHDYSHVCATKRLMRAGAPCPGPRLATCVRCAAAKHGPLVGPGVAVATALSRRRREAGIAAFVAVSAAVARAAGPKASGSVEVVPNFVPDELLVDASDIGPVAPDAPILFVGDLVPDKGVEVLFAAYRLLRDPPPLLLAGRVLPESPADRPAGATVLGALPAGEVPALMRGARVVVVPSVCPDACPTVVLEAMAAGRAVVASATGGIPDLVDDGASGVLLPPGDVGALADALARLVDAPAVAEALGRRGLERVRSFTASAVAQRIEAVYERVVAPR